MLKIINSLNLNAPDPPKKKKFYGIALDNEDKVVMVDGVFEIPIQITVGVISRLCELLPDFVPENGKMGELQVHEILRFALYDYATNKIYRRYKNASGSGRKQKKEQRKRSSKSNRSHK